MPVAAPMKPNPPTPAPAQSLLPQPKQAPPTSPKPNFKASTLPRMSSPATALSANKFVGAQSPNPQFKPIPPQGSSVAVKPSPVFKVSKIDAKLNPSKWQPTSIQSVDYNHPRHNFNATEGRVDAPHPYNYSIE